MLDERRRVLRGDDPDVAIAPQLWINVDSSTPEKQRARAEHVARRRFESMPATVDPEATRIIEPTTPRVVRAVKQYVGRDGQVVRVGDEWDASDPFVHSNPDMFGPDEAA